MTFDRNEYMRLYYYKQNLTDACRQYIYRKGLLQADLSQEEIREKINEYKTLYELKKKKKADKEAQEEAKRRYKFIYG